MIQEFIQHIRSKHLLDASKKYLLAISGGSDSVCLGYLLKETGITFELAHVNYHLREEESEQDEQFIRELAESWGVNLYIKDGRYEESDYPGMSLQMAAREIRYVWFNELLNKTGATGVLMAHHFEDQIETIFLNQLRGTGIEGVSGMSEKRGPFIRPLLPFRKIELISYLELNNRYWREDSSNKKSIYKRNFLRNEILPLIQSEFPEGLQGLDHTSKRLKDTGKAFFHFFSTWKDQNIKKEDGFEYLKIGALENLPGKSSVLFYWLRDFGFQFASIKDIIHGVDAKESGKIYLSHSHLLNLDRDYLILGKIDSKIVSSLVQKNDVEVLLGGKKYDLLKLTGNYEMDYSSQNAMLDLEKIKFPVLFRAYHEGDRIIPIGMKTHKKVSDLLVDLKIPIIKKKQVMVMTSGEDIVWVVGIRISDKYKCDKNTKSVFYIKNQTHE